MTDSAPRSALGGTRRSLDRRAAHALDDLLAVARNDAGALLGLQLALAGRIAEGRDRLETSALFLALAELAADGMLGDDAERRLALRDAWAANCHRLGRELSLRCAAPSA